MTEQIDFMGNWSEEYDLLARRIIPAYEWLYDLARNLMMSHLGKEA